MGMGRRRRRLILSSGKSYGSIQSWKFQIYSEVTLTLGVEVQLLQVLVQFSGASVIRHSNLIWGTKTVLYQLFKMNGCLLLFESQIAMWYKSFISQGLSNPQITYLMQSFTLILRNWSTFTILYYCIEEIVNLKWELTLSNRYVACETVTLHLRQKTQLMMVIVIGHVMVDEVTCWSQSSSSTGSVAWWSVKVSHST